MAKETLLYAQSGGVTAVINATAAAVITEARSHRVKVLAARNGILGALREDLIDTSKESITAIRALTHTPGGAFAHAVSSSNRLKPITTSTNGYLKYSKHITCAGSSTTVVMTPPIQRSKSHS